MPDKTILPDGRIQCRVKIKLSYKGRVFEYLDPASSPGSQFINPDGDPSTSWWTTGKTSCDRNKIKFLPGIFRYDADLYDEEGEPLRGNKIKILEVKPIDSSLPTLILAHTEGRTMTKEDPMKIKQCPKCGHHCREGDGYCSKCGAQVEHIKCEPWTEFRCSIHVVTRCKDYKAAQAQLNRVVAHCEYEAFTIVGCNVIPLTKGHRLTWHEDRE